MFITYLIVATTIATLILSAKMAEKTERTKQFSIILAQIFHGVGLVVVGWGGVFVGLVGSPSPFDSWFLGQGVRP
ncbi:hypothetical protein CFELI_10710 [Corynebacterium felinum]|uniref:Uncharacterized protein n=1 Tax=Corynebacterium felinum TaxID=131318 RepID=A0ABU2B4M5_9CORY|nr:hypothetical protein [Corynebacterium felinum]WJY95740.1 hypothetical protein CFELI_10710 [Corynebacterium felinum]